MVTATIGKSHYKTEITTTGHSVVADEGVDVGGSNLGPSPGEFLLTALASCTAITLRMYADRKKWNVDRVVVEVSSEKIDGTTVFTREVLIEGMLDVDQRARMLQIANSCPVHQTLTNPITVNTSLV